jgi:hypothetical protein
MTAGVRKSALIERRYTAAIASRISSIVTSFETCASPILGVTTNRILPPRNFLSWTTVAAIFSRSTPVASCDGNSNFFNSETTSSRSRDASPARFIEIAQAATIPMLMQSPCGILKSVARSTACPMVWPKFRSARSPEISRASAATIRALIAILRRTSETSPSSRAQVEESRCVTLKLSWRDPSSPSRTSGFARDDSV